MTAPIIYQGIKFPFQKGLTSFPASVTDDDLIRESLLQLVLTMNGERIMRPDCGTNVYSFVFENNDTVLSNLLRAEIQSVVAKYEPRVQLTDIAVSQKDAQIILTLVYVILTTRRTSSATILLPTP